MASADCRVDTLWSIPKGGNHGPPVFRGHAYFSYHDGAGIGRSKSPIVGPSIIRGSNVAGNFRADGGEESFSYGITGNILVDWARRE